MNRHRLTIVLAGLALFATANSTQAQVARQPVAEKLNWESANAKRMFVVTNDGSPIAAISLDTTNEEELRAAMKLQELIFRAGGARLPIVDKQYVRVRWGMIHINWDHFPMTERKHPFVIEMQQSDSTAFNPAKLIQISGSAQGVERAVSAFTRKAFGVPLESLEDKSFQWQPRKVLAIPERMETIHGQRQRE